MSRLVVWLLLSGITSWAPFNMSSGLQAQLLKLEEAMEEARKVGSPLSDELKTAVLMKCIGGQLKTFITVNMTETMTYQDVRELLLKWDRSQFRWTHGLILGHDNDNRQQEPTPMDIDRVQQQNHWWKQREQRLWQVHERRKAR